ncbi:MAG: preprotein translocase subunit SecG [Bacillota bacterium]|jgi:preprotein translocase subunit SecG
MKVLISVLQVIAALGLIATVLLQSGRSAGISGAIAGGAEHIFGKKKGIDDFLGRLSAIFAIAFLFLCLLLSLI